MDWLAFLAEPAFVIPWYLFGALAAGWVYYDLHHTNTVLKKAIGWAWPIVVFFFSVIGLALYLATARAPGIGDARSEEEKHKLHNRRQQAMWRRVNGAVIHCVAGDGLGIMTGMVIARLLEMSFWQEFWFEYAVGFAFGWFIFQYRAMTMMTDSKLRALAMAFRAELFSMLTVMGGMGAMMAYVTPMVVGMQPKPWTAAFWGFGMLGLLVGYVFTFPMNWMLVKVGWKHGMGSPEGASLAHGTGARTALFAGMCALGLAATVLPGWLAVQRQWHDVAVAHADTSGAAAAAPDSAAQRGLASSLQQAQQALAQGERTRATAALDNAMRAAQVLHAAAIAPGAQAEEAIRSAQRALQDGRPHAAAGLLTPPASSSTSAKGETHSTQAYEGAMLVDASGAVIGKVLRIEGDRAQLAVGGVHDFWGFWNVGWGEQAWVPIDRLLLGPAHAVGKTYAMLPTLQDAREALAQAR